MPELPEVEAYRRLAERALGRQIASVEAPDTWFVKRGLHPVDVAAALACRELSGARRKGKLLMLDTGGSGPVLGLRFGRTGRLVLDGVAGVDDLLYASNDPRPEWERFGLTFADGTRMGVIDPRRLGGVELDPDEAALGPDALSVSAGGLRGALCGSRAPL